MRQQPAKQEPGTAYVDAKRCQPCHSAIHNSYLQVGMAQAFAPASRLPAMEDAEFVHAASGGHYQTVRRGGRIFQRRFELNAKGEQTNVYELEATLVVGSGN